MSYGKNLGKIWVESKFNAKCVLSLDEKGQYLNLGVTLMGGKEFTTKDGVKGMSVQIDPNEIEKIVKWLNVIKKDHFS